MHSLLFSAALCLVLLLELSVGSAAIPVGLMVCCMAVAVSFIGLPHGADDSRVGLQILDRILGRSESGSVLTSGSVLMSGTMARAIRPVLFVAAYLSVAAAVVAGWYWMPVLTILVFFALSAWHFGSEEEWQGLEETFIRIPLAIACGGMVIWVPILFQPDAVEGLLRIIIPGNAHALSSNVQPASAVIQILKPFSIACLVILAFGLIGGSWSSRSAAIQRIRVVLLFALLATTDPLLGFAVYFCGWHSIGELIGFTRQYGTVAMLRLVPMTVAAIGCFAAGFLVWHWTGSQPWSENLIRTIFIGLSAVAIPHLLLHFCEEKVGMLSSANQIREAY
jgi:beta-carotene 15,15'-dioxygenase